MQIILCLKYPVACILCLFSFLLHSKDLISTKEGWLENIIPEIAKSYNLQVFAKDDLIQDIWVKQIQAENARDFIQVLLRDTGLKAEWLSENSFVIQQKKIVEQQKANQNQILKPEITNYKQLIEIVGVTGLQMSLRHSLQYKRFSDKIVDVIASEDIGKLPDTTIADSLQRITGVQVGRSAGEGASLNIRGVPQATLLLNGEQMLTAGSITQLQPELIDVPSSLVSSLEVIKSPDASMYYSGISGAINLRSYRPFNFDPGLSVSGLVEGSWGSLLDEPGGMLHLLTAYHGNDFGISASITSSRVELANHQWGTTGNAWWRGVDESNGFYDSSEDIADYTGDGDDNDSFIVSQGHAANNSTIARSRLGSNLSLQYQVNKSFNITFDALFTQMQQQERTTELRVHQAWMDEWGWYLPKTIIARPDLYHDGSLAIMQQGTLQARSIIAHSASIQTNRSSLNTNLEFVFDSEDYSNNLRLIFATADSNLTNNVVDSWLTDGSSINAKHVNSIESVYANPKGYQGSPLVNANGDVIVNSNGQAPHTVYPVEIDYTGDEVKWTIPNFGDDSFGQELSRYGLVSTNSGRNYDDDTRLFTIRDDFTYHFDYADITTAVVGLRYANKKVQRKFYDYVAPFTSSQNRTIYARWKDAKEVFPDTEVAYIPLINFEQLPQNWLLKVDDFGGAKGIPPVWFINPKVMDDALVFQNELFPGNIKSEYPSESYSIAEEIAGFYLKLNLTGQLFNQIDYKANLGLNHKYTSIETLQYTSGLSTVPWVVDSKVYTRGPGTQLPAMYDSTYLLRKNSLLPQINIAMMPTDELVIRLAASKKQLIQDANQLGRGTVIKYEQDDSDPTLYNAISATQNGNPMLTPWQSNNLDFSFEWYYSEDGLLSLGAFMMEVDAFTENTSYRVSDIPDSDGVERNQRLFFKTIAQSAGGLIKGLELNYTTSLKWLSSSLRHWGLMFNYTWSPSESANTDYYGNLLPVLDNSEHQANTIVWYDYDKWQMRMAWNYRSETFLGKVFVWDSNIKVNRPFASWQSATNYLDFSVSYRINENLKLYLNGNNLTEQAIKTWLQWPELVDKHKTQEARFSLGMQVKF